MLWVYVLLTTAGVVTIVPTILRAIDGKAADLITGFTGFVGLFGGLTGLFARQAGAGGLTTFIAAAAVGLAAGALHPEMLTMLRGEPLIPDTTSPDTRNADTRNAEKKTELTHDES